MRLCSPISLIAPFLALGLIVACSSKDNPPGAVPNDAGQDVVAQDSFVRDAADGATVCDAPDLLILLDRSVAMANRPDGTTPLDTEKVQSRWALASSAIAKVTAAPADQTHRFGLMLFPQDPSGTACVTLSQKITGTAQPSNAACEGAELVVPADFGAGARIAAALDIDKSHLCGSNPIAAALGSALAAAQASAASKHVVALVTDGREGCRADVLAAMDALASAGVRAFVIGLGMKGASGADGGSDGTLDTEALNHMACAARTADHFATACAKSDGGTVYVALKPNGARLYLAAEAESDLASALTTVSAQAVCASVAGGG